MRTEFLIAALFLSSCGPAIGPEKGDDGPDTHATHQAYLDGTVTVPQATQVEATRVANIQALQTNIPDQQRLRDKLAPLDQSLVGVYQGGYCTGILVSVEPAYDKYGNLVGELGFIDTSSHCVSSSDQDLVKPQPGFPIGITKLDNVQQGFFQVSYINGAQFGDADDASYKHSLMVVMGGVGTFNGILPTGLDIFAEYNSDSHHDCVTGGLPNNGAYNLPTFAEVSIDDKPLANGSYGVESLGINGGGSGGPLICEDKSGQNKVVGEIQWKTAASPTMGGVSINTERDIELYKFHLEQLKLEAVEWVTSQ